MANDSVEQLMNLAIRHMDRGRIADAAALLRQVLAGRGDHAAAHYLLGNCLLQLGQAREAIISYERALHFVPRFSEAQANLGVALMYERRIEEAAGALQTAIGMNPGNAEAHNNLGMALQFLGRLEESRAAYEGAIRCRPNYSEAHNNLGNINRINGNFDEAIACYREALLHNPNNASAHYNLGCALHAQRKLDEAIDCFHHALYLAPNVPEVHNDLGLALKDRGEVDSAAESHRRALKLQEHDPKTHSMLIFTMHYQNRTTAAEILNECRNWDRKFAAPLRTRIRPHTNTRDPRRRLRIGYVSADFRDHPVARFMLPLLEAHDREGFEVFCYANVAGEDEMTRQLRSRADQWRSISGVGDQEAADLIRRDEIDILVDLNMHLFRNRLLVFAHKPAPVQVTYLAYCSTTGLETMDYRITDGFMDPIGEESNYSEQSIRIPSYWCYSRPDAAVLVGPLPAMQNGAVTFGCLNNFCKVSDGALDAWAQILSRVPGARLILHAHPGVSRERVARFMKTRGVEASRCTFVGMAPLEDYLRTYQRIDIALDPFPFAGGTTTCDALWMGVPVITLAGRTAVGRGGVSILSNLGLQKHIARSSAEYVAIAAELANDLPRLSELRVTLRERMEHSPLMDAQGFARSIEAAYREMWQRFCA